MGTTPTTTNSLASIINGVIKAGMDGGATAAETAAIAAEPWLGWPVINQVFDYFVSKIEGYFYVEAANAATKLVIDLQTDQETSQTLSAFKALQAAVAGGDPQAIASASAAMDAAFGSLIHSDGSASP